jgi:hypothetical protein
MKSRIHILPGRLAVLLSLAVAGLLPLRAAPPAPQAKPEIQPSVSKFVIPSNPAEGRDPFFPNSTRIFAGNPKNPVHRPELTELALKSILGIPPHAFAIINNHTFAAGDEGDVTTQSGQRLHIACVDINPQAGTATVEANGTRAVLHLQGGL